MLGVGNMLHSMARVNQLLDHEEYISHMEKIDMLEKERLFCKHGFEHGLNVARIAYSYLLENGETLLHKESVYAAALLHDIGRWIEYGTGEDHAEASARLALPLLEECGFLWDEIQVILKGIREHRRHHEDHLTLLGTALALADDWARDCRHCSGQDLCHKYHEAMNRVMY
jgi:putative nucleotidyltransferase with HDIG domain